MMNLTCAILHADRQVSEQLEAFIAKTPFLALCGKYSNPIEALKGYYSEVMTSHQRGGMHANQVYQTLPSYRKPKNFEAFLYMNHVLQGDAIKTAIEAHRRDMPYCMGTLFWQHNDCWPVASWASRDYYGRWKAQHYFARKAYRDILVSPITDEDEVLNIQVVSDRLKSCIKDFIISLPFTIIAVKISDQFTYKLCLFA